MPALSPEQVTTLLNQWRGGSSDAEAALIPVIEGELRRLARHYLRRDRRNHTLETGALVNEAFARIMGAQPVEFANRSHFFAIAANNMRWVLVDYARKRAQRVDGHGQCTTLDERLQVGSSDSWEHVLALHRTLDKLAEIFPRKARVVEMRFFGDLKIAEIAEVLGVATKTVVRDWEFARNWLYAEMSRPPASDP